MFPLQSVGDDVVQDGHSRSNVAQLRLEVDSSLQIQQMQNKLKNPADFVTKVEIILGHIEQFGPVIGY